MKMQKVNIDKQTITVSQPRKGTYLFKNVLLNKAQELNRNNKILIETPEILLAEESVNKMQSVPIVIGGHTTANDNEMVRVGFVNIAKASVDGNVYGDVTIDNVEVAKSLENNDLNLSVYYTGEWEQVGFAESGEEILKLIRVSNFNHVAIVDNPQVSSAKIPSFNINEVTVMKEKEKEKEKQKQEVKLTSVSNSISNNISKEAIEEAKAVLLARAGAKLQKEAKREIINKSRVEADRKANRTFRENMNNFMASFFGGKKAEQVNEITTNNTIVNKSATEGDVNQIANKIVKQAEHETVVTTETTQEVAKMQTGGNGMQTSGYSRIKATGESFTGNENIAKSATTASSDTLNTGTTLDNLYKEATDACLSLAEEYGKAWRTVTGDNITKHRKVFVSSKGGY